MLGQTTITDSDLNGLITTLRRLERFWMQVSDPFESRGQVSSA
jgi:hypothetical protein